MTALLFNGTATLFVCVILNEVEKNYQSATKYLS